jgi:hypothetical protein
MTTPVSKASLNPTTHIVESNKRKTSDTTMETNAQAKKAVSYLENNSGFSALWYADTIAVILCDYMGQGILFKIQCIYAHALPQIIKCDKALDLRFICNKTKLYSENVRYSSYVSFHDNLIRKAFPALPNCHMTARQTYLVLQKNKTLKATKNAEADDLIELMNNINDSNLCVIFNDFYKNNKNNNFPPIVLDNIKKGTTKEKTAYIKNWMEVNKEYLAAQQTIDLSHKSLTMLPEEIIKYFSKIDFNHLLQQHTYDWPIINTFNI